MAVQITLIGLGQIGASMGLALGAHKESLLRVGHDKKVEIEREAQKVDAVDKVIHNLPSAVREARLVVLCLPLNQVRETLEIIAQDLKDGSVVLDTSPIKAQVFKWAHELLPKGCNYVGIVPALNPNAIHNQDIGISAAQADLFNEAVIFIDAPPGVPEAAVSLTSDFVRLLGATPVLADMLESDGLMAAVHLLPQLTSAALLNATVDQPGWQESRKLAGRFFAAMTSNLTTQDEIDSLQLAAMQNRTSTLHALDTLMAALKGLRDDIEKGDEAGVMERLEAALEGYKRWLNERHSADWSQTTSRPVDAPSFAERLFGTAIAKPKR